MYVIKVGNYYVKYVGLVRLEKITKLCDITLSKDDYRVFTRDMAKLIARELYGEIIEYEKL